MIGNKHYTIIPDIISALLIMLFVYTSLDKLFHLAQFRVVLSSSPYIKPIAQQLSIFIPITELAIAILLFIPAKRFYGLLFSFFIMAAFTAYLGLSLAMGSKLPCACGGVISKLTWSQHLVFNVVILMITSLAIYMKHSSFYCNKQEQPKTCIN